MKKQYVSPEAELIELADEIFTGTTVGGDSGEPPIAG